MINSAGFEYKVFLLALLFGVISGAIYGVLNMVVVGFKNNIVLKNVLDGLFMLIFAGLLFYCLNAFNYGAFRMHLLITYIVGFLLERKTIGKLFAKLFLLVYNYIVKTIKKFKQTKPGVFLFK